MPPLRKDLRRELENAVKAARRVAEAGALEALEALAVGEREPFAHMKGDPPALALRNQLRARGRSAGDQRDVNSGRQTVRHLAGVVAYEHWHRMLFARFLAENGLLLEPGGVAVSLADVEELAREEKADVWELAGSYAKDMLPQIFRSDDPALALALPREVRVKLEKLLADLPREVFSADDSLGWVYQFWRAEEKDAVNKAGAKIDADTLPAVTQLFTEHYMVEFLLHNTLGAWWTAKVEAAGRTSDIPLPYLRRKEDGTPAAGSFPGWPKTVRELRVLDPCCGSGHFLVALLQLLVAMLREEENLSAEESVRVVLGEVLHGLEIDARCTQLAAFNVAFAAWRLIGSPVILPALRIACSGLSVGATRDEWLAAAEDKDARFLIGQLYDLFQKAPELGSLINPARLSNIGRKASDLLPVVQELLAVDPISNPERHELGVTAAGVAQAAEILGGAFHLVTTNVPYLGRPKQADILIDYCDRWYSDAKSDLATCFVERCLEFCRLSGSTALVTPQNWLFLGSYQNLRTKFLRKDSWNCIARLGPKAFQTPMWDFNTCLIVITHEEPNDDFLIAGNDVSLEKTFNEKSDALINQLPVSILQVAQLQNPDARLAFEERKIGIPLMNASAECYQGVRTGDRDRFVFSFWEMVDFINIWEPFRNTSSSVNPSDGITEVLRWEHGRGALHIYAKATRHKLHDMHESGNRAWGKRGVGINQMAKLKASLFFGEKFDGNLNVIIPSNEALLPALWAFCSAPEYEKEVRQLDQKLAVTNATLSKVPFDLAHWQQIAAEKYPDGLPKPHSDDPTQWLFNGHPRGSEHPLQVAVARLLGYRWPRQTGSSFPDCPALDNDGLEPFADEDGIVCLPPLSREASAADRLRPLLAAALGAFDERQLLAAAGAKARNFEDWLRDEFFERHCKLFHDRPFVWHVWDGRSDGFHALVNCHRLAAPDGAGGKRLEKLAYSYLGDWIRRQRDDAGHGKPGAEDRLAAAETLQQELKNILAGEPPYDVFVRWKPLHRQAIGWNPDLNDGVRLNLRPFLKARDIGRKGAGILRFAPNVKWTKDRGAEPFRPREDFPWFWSWDEKARDFPGGAAFDGNRWNDLHYTTATKHAARAVHSMGTAIP